MPTGTSRSGAFWKGVKGGVSAPCRPGTALVSVGGSRVPRTSAMVFPSTTSVCIATQHAAITPRHPNED